MRILFLLSSLEPAGSETYCLSLAEAWQGKHEIFWISDKLHNGQTYQSWPIHRKGFSVWRAQHLSRGVLYSHPPHSSSCIPIRAARIGSRPKRPGSPASRM